MLECFYCHAALAWNQATRDHLIPKSRGGGGAGNCVWACQACNNDKADLMPMAYVGDPRLMRKLYERRLLVASGAYIPAVVREGPPPPEVARQHSPGPARPARRRTQWLRLPKMRGHHIGLGCAPFATSFSAASLK